MNVSKNKQVAILLSPPLTESFELTLARALDLKRQAVPLCLLYCNGTTKGCVVNPFKFSMICSHCKSVLNRALNENFNDVVALPIDNFDPGVDNDLDAINGLKIWKAKLWQGVVSTIMTFYRIDINIESKEQGSCRLLFSTMAKNFDAYSNYVYLCLSKYLSTNNPARIEFFNGRIVPGIAAMSAAVQQGVNFTVIEVSGFGYPIFLAHNHSVHDLSYLKTRLKNYISDNRFDAELGVRFFENRRSGMATDGPSFLGRQKPGYVSCPPGLKIIAIFLSSPDEFEISGDQWFTLASKAPASFVIKLRQKLSDEYLVVVRMHPNQDGDKTGKTKQIMDQLSDVRGLLLIKPKDRQSTYELIDVCSCVLSFGSTVGLEATYWGKVSLLAGRAPWEDTGVAYVVKSPTEAVELIKSKPAPCSKKQAVMVGSYFMDRKDTSESLSWGAGGGYGFFVDGKSYLRYKRQSIVYWGSRAFDKFLRGVCR